MKVGDLKGFLEGLPNNAEVVMKAGVYDPMEDYIYPEIRETKSFNFEIKEEKGSIKGTVVISDSTEE